MATDTPLPAPSPAQEAPPTADARESVRAGTRDALANLSAAIETDLQRFTGLAKEKSDFEGDDGDAIENNGAFKMSKDGLKLFFEASQIDAPEKLQKAWRDAAVDFMIAEIQSYDKSWGTMGIRQVEASLKALSDPNTAGHSGQKGVGGFEQWVKNPPQSLEYAKWQAEQKQKAEQAQTVDQKKADLKGKLTAAKEDPVLKTVAQFPGMVRQFEAIGGEIEGAGDITALSSLEANIAALIATGGKIQTLYDSAIATETRAMACAAFLPTALSDEIKGIKTNVTESGGTNLAGLEASIAAFSEKLKPFEELRPLAENAEIPAERRTQILTALRERKQTPEQAKVQLEAAQQAANLPLTADEDAPAIDKLLGWVDSMEEGKMKKVLGGIALALASICATLSKAPLIGSWFRGKMISNRLLAEKFGDEEAALAVKVETEFRKFGLPEDLVAELGGKKTKEVIALVRQKPEKITTDKPTQAKLAVLAGQLEAKGGAGSDDKLVDFMGNASVWTGIEYPGVAVAAAAAAVAPATAPTENPEAAKLAKIFESMTADDRAALENAKAKDTANGTLPDAIKDNDRAKKIAIKIKTNGAAEATIDPNQTVLAFIQANLAKDWTIA